MVKISKIGTYDVKSGESYFFDNNVWMLLFSPIANSREQSQRKYSNLLSEIQSRGGMIFISSLVLSEYINRNLRLSFKIWKDKTGNFNADYKRDYRPTQEYRDDVKAVESQVQDILKITVRRPDDFNALDIERILKDMSDSDFNDEYYIQLCKLGNLKLVTDDSDMLKTSYDIEIITQ